MKQVILSLLLLVSLFTIAASAKRAGRSPAHSSCVAKCLTTVSKKHLAQCVQEACRVERTAAAAAPARTKRSSKHVKTAAAAATTVPSDANSLSDSSSRSSSTTSGKCFPVNYPQLRWYKQCDIRWGDDGAFGPQTNLFGPPGQKVTTICGTQGNGSMVSSAAMALNGLGFQYDWKDVTPGTLNARLERSGGTSVSRFWNQVTSGNTLLYQETITDKQAIIDSICRYKVVIVNLSSSGRWVLATGASDDGSTIYIKDPGSVKTSAPRSDIARAAILKLVN